jgi:hypothetical protein
MAGSEVAKLFDRTQPAVSNAAQHGEKLALENNLDLLGKIRIFMTDPMAFVLAIAEMKISSLLVKQKRYPGHSAQRRIRIGIQRIATSSVLLKIGVAIIV